MKIVETDLSSFGGRELRMASELLNAYLNQNDTRIFGQGPGSGVKLCFNMNSGYVFLTDEEYNVAMVSGGKLEDWITCPECGDEGFREDMTCDHWKEIFGEEEEEEEEEEED